MKNIIKCKWLENEKWKHYKTHYYVSDMGRVYSTFGNGRIMKLQINKGGYYRITIRVDKGIQKNFLLHRIVAELFVYNDDIHNKDVVDHINNNKKDNRSCNLQWLSNVDNIMKAYNDGLCTHISLYRQKETIEIDNDGNIIGRWKTLQDCSRETEISFSAINKVCLGVQVNTHNRIFRYT